MREPFQQAQPCPPCTSRPRSTYKFCSPTRAALMAGRVPGHGIWETNPGFANEVGVDLKLELMPALLQRAGYYTAHIGKCVLVLSAQYSDTSAVVLIAEMYFFSAAATRLVGRTERDNGLTILQQHRAKR